MMRTEPPDVRGMWVDTAALRQALRTELRARGLWWYDLTQATGIAGSTFSRMRNGGALSTQNLARLTTWLGQPAETFYRYPDEVSSTGRDDSGPR